MNDTIEQVLSILRYIMYRKKDTICESILNKKYDYSIEYVSPISITIIPKVIYILTKYNNNRIIIIRYIYILYSCNSKIEIIK